VPDEYPFERPLEKLGRRRARFRWFVKPKPPMSVPRASGEPSFPRSFQFFSLSRPASHVSDIAAPTCSHFRNRCSKARSCAFLHRGDAHRGWEPHRGTAYFLRCRKRHGCKMREMFRVGLYFLQLDFEPREPQKSHGQSRRMIRGERFGRYERE